MNILNTTSLPKSEHSSIILGGLGFEVTQRVRQILGSIKIVLMTKEEGLGGMDKYKRIKGEYDTNDGLDPKNTLVRDYLLLLKTADSGEAIYQSSLERGINSSLTTLLLLNGYKIEFCPPKYGNIPCVRIIRI